MAAQGADELQITCADQVARPQALLYSGPAAQCRWLRQGDASRIANKGHVAEWLRNGLQNRVLRFNSGRGLHLTFYFTERCFTDRESRKSGPASCPPARGETQCSLRSGALPSSPSQD